MTNVNNTARVTEHPVIYSPGRPLELRFLDIRRGKVHYHMHSIEMIMCLQGSVDILCNHENITLHPGEVFTIDYRDMHCLYSDTENLVLQVHINMADLSHPESFMRNVYLACQDLDLHSFQKEPLQEIKSVLLALAYTASTSANLEDEVVSRSANRIVDLMIRYFDWFSYMNFSDGQIETVHERIQYIFDDCHNNYMNRITIADLADLVHLNENYTSQFLGKSSYGSFQGMLGFIRSFEAQYLLLNTDLSISEISSLCGFSDERYFNKNFFNWWGRKPRELREWFHDYSAKSEDFTIKNGNDVHGTIKDSIATHFTDTVLR